MQDVKKNGTKSITKALRYLGFTVFDWGEQISGFLDHAIIGSIFFFKNYAEPDVRRNFENADAIMSFTCL